MQGLISLGVNERALEDLAQLIAHIPACRDQPGNANPGAHPLWEAKA